MKHVFRTLFLTLLVAGFSLITHAQVNGTAVDPTISTAENPVYYMIESASDGSHSFNGFTGDFRGNVLISPTSAGKIMHNKLSTAPTSDHVLWQIITVDGVQVLKNKATGMYMSGSHSVASTVSGNDFNFAVISGKQYRIRNGSLSYTNSWQNNLCDRINVGTTQANSLVSWYFIAPSPLGATIATAASLLSTTQIGVHPGQYTTAARRTLQEAIEAAIVARDNGDESDNEEAQQTLEAAIAAYQQSQNGILISNETEEHWYWIKSPRGSTAAAVFAENMGNGNQVLHSERAVKDAQLWKVIENGNGHSIVNKQGGAYLNTNVGNNQLITVITQAPTTPVYLNKSSYATDNTDFINFYLVENTTNSSAATFRMHAGATTHNWGLMNWTGGISDNCSFQFLLYDPSDLLNIAIMSNEELYASSPAGIHPGMYPTQEKATYRSAIDAAKAVHANEEATIEDKTAAAETLNDARTAFLATRNTIRLSTEEEATWYYIVSAHTGYANGQVITNQGATAGTTILVEQKRLDPNKLWKFNDEGNGKMSIQNMASALYISANPRSNGSSATPVAFNANWMGADAQYLFNADEQTYLHAQQSGSMLVTWGTNTLGSASAWRLEEVSTADAEKPVDIQSITINQGTYTTTGIGNTNHGMANIVVNTNGVIGSVTLHSVTVDLRGSTRARTFKNLKLYHTGSSNRLNPATHTLLAQINNPLSVSDAIVITLDEPFEMPAGSTNFYLATDIAEDAMEGDIVDNRVLSLNYSYLDGTSKAITPQNTETPLYSIVYLKRVQLLTPGDYGSVSYRIPAITTAKDGSLVALTDKRKFNSGDLPGDIDIVAQISKDGGATWTEPIMVVEGKGYGKGYGDPVIMTTQSGKLITLYVGGPGLWSSTPENPIRHYMSTSDDNGLTWNGPIDITPQLFGAECPDPIRSKWRGSFFGSGHGLTMRNGRVMAVIAVVEPGMNGLQNYAVYTDNEGASWQVSNRAIVGGDEAKVVELDNGDILMSSRTGGNRLWAKSSDGGLNWGPRNSWTQIWGNACDADLIRYTSVKDGYNKSRLLHTLPNASDRRNLTMWISYDEGTTWNTKKTLCPGTSAYSSFTILPDGTIGVYFEEDGSIPYTMTYINFTLDWLTDGKDSYEPPISSTKNLKANDDLVIRAVNKKIVVEGSDENFRLFNLNGIELPASQELEKGLYIVVVNGYKGKIVEV